MKKRTIFCWLLMGIIIFANTDCTKVVDPPDNTRITPSPPPQPITIHVDAGRDIILVLPVNETYLNGSYSYTGTSIGSISWTQVGGPASFVIENRNALQTRVTNLAGGVYQFELTVTDSMGLFDKDTTTITVTKLYTNEIIFSDQIWLFNYTSFIIIPDLYTHLPAGVSFKVFMKKDNINTWQEVLQTGAYDFGFFIDNGDLWIMSLTGSNETDTPDIKIIY